MRYAKFKAPWRLSGRKAQAGGAGLPTALSGAPAPLDIRSTDRATLVAAMGAEPKPGKGDSIAYKAVLAGLDEYRLSAGALADLRMDDARMASGLGQLTDTLARIQDAATAYEVRHAGDDAKAQRRAVMKALVASIAAESTSLSELRRRGGLDGLAAPLTLQQAMAFARHGVDPATQGAPARLREDRIDAAKSDEQFGSGAVNSVKKLVYRAEDGEDAFVRIFKPELDAGKAAIPGAAQATGIDPFRPKLGKRNIASRKASERLGLGDMIPSAEFATHGGELGLAMDLAPGRSLIKKIDVDVEDVDAAAIPLLGAALSSRAAGDPDWANRLPKDYKEKDGKIRHEQPHGRSLPLDEAFAPAAVVAEVRRAMMSLQVLDALCGQIDRHPENYLLDVDDDGRVTLTGIDNDFSFGKNLKDPGRSLGDNRMGMPPLIDRALADRIAALDWDTYSAGMDAELDREELDAAKARFDWIKDKVVDMTSEGRVVDDWQNFQKDGQSLESILMNESDGGISNYYRRDVLAQRSYRGKGRLLDD